MGFKRNRYWLGVYDTLVMMLGIGDIGVSKF